jgi:TRAP-type C4-dicarboxylate transport system permease small subunit
VRFDLIYRALPEKGRLLLETIFNLLINGVFLALLWPTIRYTIQMYPIKASALRVPWTFLLLVFPIFVALVLIHNFTSIVKDILRLTGRQIKDTEVFPWQ